MSKQFYVVGKLNGEGNEQILAQGNEFDLLAPIIDKVEECWKNLRIVKGTLIKSKTYRDYIPGRLVP